MDNESAATRCFQFLIMPRRQVCVRSESGSSRVLKRWLSSGLALLSVSGVEIPLLSLACCSGGRAAEMADVRLSILGLGKCGVGMADGWDKFHPPLICLQDVNHLISGV